MHFESDKATRLVSKDETPSLSRSWSWSRSRSRSRSASALGIVWYSQLIIVIIANLQIDMKLISAPVERGDEAVLHEGEGEETTSWSAASREGNSLRNLFFVCTPLDTL